MTNVHVDCHFIVTNILVSEAWTSSRSKLYKKTHQNREGEKQSPTKKNYFNNTIFAFARWTYREETKITGKFFFF